MDDALIGIAEAKAWDAELLAVGGQLIHLSRGDLIIMEAKRFRCRNAVVSGGEGKVGTAHLQSAGTEAPKRLAGKSDFVDEMEIDLKIRLGLPGCSWTIWESQIFSIIVRGFDMA